MYTGIFYLEKISPCLSPALMGEFLSHKYFVNDYIEPMVTFTASVNIYSARVGGLGEIFVQRVFGCTVEYERNVLHVNA